MTRRLRLAVPNKGRLVEPTVGLLHDAGLVFEAGERALVARVQNFDLEILFVRDCQAEAAGHLVRSPEGPGSPCAARRRSRARR